eukprot:TRINITY_DN4622_c0_g2_i5.p1 TRINITY_DN4622_c0_g2~~TRINITY_DN4622_c0_g2_i5.p1  ORF type:complete len:315 (-),score=4.17 TRINITY_DN4622_c0_g2_i5:449-1393(-)
MDFLQSASFDDMMAAMMMEPSWCPSPKFPAKGGPHSFKPLSALVVPSQAVKFENEEEVDFHFKIEALLTSPPNLCSAAVNSTSTTERLSAASGPGKSANNSEVSSLEDLNSKKRRSSDVVLQGPPKTFFGEAFGEQAVPIMKKRARTVAASSAEMSFPPPAAASANAQTAASILESLFAASPFAMKLSAAGVPGVPQFGNATVNPVATFDERAVIDRILYNDLASRHPGGGSAPLSQRPFDRPALIPAASSMQQGGFMNGNARAFATPASTLCTAATRPSNAGGAAPASRLSCGRKEKIQPRSMREKHRRHKIL